MNESIKPSLFILGKDKDVVTLYPFNSYWQANMPDGETVNYRELNHALRDLLNDGYGLRDIKRRV